MSSDQSADRLSDHVMPSIDVLHLGISVLPPGQTYGPVEVPCWVFGWMVDGTSIALVNGQELPLRPGIGLLTRPLERVAYRWGPEDAVRHGFVMFSVLDAEPDWPRETDLPEGHLVSHLLDHVLWLDAERPTGWWNAVGPAFEYALRLMVSGYVAMSQREDHALPIPIVDSLRYAARRWNKAGTMSGVSLEELAKAAGVSQKHLCRVFASELGVGPARAMRLLRLHRAATLLSQTKLSVAEVARRIGFESEFHFSRTFKAVSGVSPSIFRSDPRSTFELPPNVRRLHNYLTASGGEG